MLQVTIHDHHRVPRRQLQPCEDGRLLAEVSGELRALDFRVLLRRFPYQLQGGVPGTVAYEYEFVVNLVFLQQPGQHFGGVGDILFLIIGRQHNR